MLFSNRDLKKLIIPLVIEQVLALTIGMFDTMMVSQCGQSAVSGVSIVDGLNVLIINIFSALATGGAVVVSRSRRHRWSWRRPGARGHPVAAAGLGGGAFPYH